MKWFLVVDDFKTGENILNAKGTVDVSETDTGCWWKKSLARQPRLPDKKPFGFWGKAVFENPQTKKRPQKVYKAQQVSTL